MNALAVVATCVIVFAYIECAIGTGYYMFLITSKATQGQQSDEEKKQIKKYSIAAGVFFPITFAILIAGHAAERKRK